MTDEPLRWIPFAERLPTDGQKVIALTRQRRVIPFDYTEAFRDDVDSGGVIGWIPWPEGLERPVPDWSWRLAIGCLHTPEVSP